MDQKFISSIEICERARQERSKELNRLIDAMIARVRSWFA